jgi:hypothetical protein
MLLTVFLLGFACGLAVAVLTELVVRQAARHLSHR